MMETPFSGVKDCETVTKVLRGEQPPRPMEDDI